MYPMKYSISVQHQNSLIWPKLNTEQKHNSENALLSHQQNSNDNWTSNYRIHQQGAVQLNTFRLSNKQLVIRAMNPACGGI